MWSAGEVMKGMSLFFFSSHTTVALMIIFIIILYFMGYVLMTHFHSGLLVCCCKMEYSVGQIVCLYNILAKKLFRGARVVQLL